LLKCVSPEHLDFMIERDKHIIASTFYAIRHRPNYPEDLSADQIRRLEAFRAQLARVALPVLGMMRRVASGFPPEVVERQVTPEWLMRRARNQFPMLADVVCMQGKRGQRWLADQAREIVGFATGRLTWDDKVCKLVEVGS